MYKRLFFAESVVSFFLIGPIFLKWWWWWYHSLTVHQHQKGHTVSKQVIMIATSIQVATVQVLQCVRAIRYQAKSEQNELIPRQLLGCATGRLPSCTPLEMVVAHPIDVIYMMLHGNYTVNMNKAWHFCIRQTRHFCGNIFVLLYMQFCQYN